MRMALIAASVAALVAAGDAGAQRVVMAGPGAGYGAPDTTHVGTPMPGGPVVGPAPRPHGGGRWHNRWGSKVDGHWWAGVNAPGGWRAYHRPERGWTLPGYWNQPGFSVNDWSDYGLGEPPAGYNWTRYYDDAVLVDGRGQVYDCVDGVNWDGPGAGYGDDQGYGGQGYGGQGYGDRGYGAGYPQPGPMAGQVQPTYGQSTYAPPYPPQGPYAGTAGYPPAPPAYVERHGSGVGGAVVGGVVGGVAGNLIGGRGNRLAGTLVGAGVGAAAGYAIDRSSTHRVPVAPRQPYDAPPYGGPGADYAPPPPPPPAYAPPPPAGGVWHSPDGGTIVSTTSYGGFGGGSTTVVTVQTAPVVTTTTTEIVEDHVTYSRHRAVRHKWVRRPDCSCR